MKLLNFSIVRDIVACIARAYRVDSGTWCRSQAQRCRALELQRSEFFVKHRKEIGWSGGFQYDWNGFLRRFETQLPIICLRKAAGVVLES